MIAARAAALAVLLLALGCREAAVEPDPLVAIAGPRTFESFEVRDGDETVVWRLEAATGTPVENLVYGWVPAGFRQTVPADGQPRPLRLAEPLVVESTTPHRIFLHRGEVDTGNRLAVGGWEMRLRSRGSEPAGADEQDAAAAAP